MKRSRFGQRFEYALFRTMMFLANAVPGFLAYGMMKWLGQAFYLVSTRRRGYALRLLRNAYPGRSDRELSRLGRRATGNLFKVAADIVRAGRWIRSGRLLDRVDTTLVRRLLPDENYIGLTAHLGSWEVAAMTVAMMHGEAHGIAKVHRNPLIRQFVTDLRAQVGLHIHARRGGLRGLKRAVEAGHRGLQVVDQNQRLRGVIAPFFGEPAATERAAATLAVRLGIPVMLGFCIRKGGGFKFFMDCPSPIWPSSSGDVRKNIDDLVHKINYTIEEFVLRYPEQYNWIHNRYRSGAKVVDHARAESPTPKSTVELG